MSLTVTEDIIDGATISRSANGYAATRVYKVIADAGENLLDIIQAEGIPQYGDLYLNETGAPIIYALEINCEPEDRQNTIFRVVVNYALPDFSQQPPSESESNSIIQVGSSVSSTKTQKDKNGDQIIVTLTNHPNQTGDVDIQVPETVILFERRESNSPLTKSIAYTGKVNNATVGIYTPRTLLCLGIEGTTTDNGDTWQVSYRFQYRPETWDATVVYIDPETDRPHQEAVIGGSGFSTVRIYQEATFSSLNLPW